MQAVDQDAPSAGASGVKMTIGSAAVLGMASTAATVLFSVVRSKTTAVVLGPEGTGLAAEVLQLVALVGTPVAFFTGPALISGLASARASGNQTDGSKIYRSAFALTALTGVLAAFVSLVASVVVFHSRGSSELYWLTGLAAVGAVGGALTSVPSQVLTVEAKLGSLTKVGILCAAIQATAVVIGTIALRLVGQFVALALVPFVSFALTLRAGMRALPAFEWRARWTISRAFLLDSLRFGAISFASAVGSQLSLSTIRWLLEVQGGPSLNGYFQAAWAIGGSYFGFVLGGIGTFAFPRYAAARSSDELAVEVQSALSFVIRVAPAAILAVLASRALIVRVLYTANFSQAVPLMGLMMAADFGRAVTWVQHGPLLYRGNLRAYLLVELLGVATVTAGSALLVPRLGLVGVGWAYFVDYLVMLPVSATALRLSTGVRVGGGRLFVTTGLMLALVGTALAGERWRGVQFVAMTASLVWAWRAGLLAAASAKVRTWYQRFGRGMSR